MAVAKKKSAMEDPWAKPGKSKPVKKITSVPKKVVEAKVKRNPNAPKPSTPSTGSVKVVPKGTKSNPRGTSRKGGRSARGGLRGGMLGGMGMRGPVIK